MTTSIQEQINDHIASILEPKRIDMEALHKFIVQINPNSKLWYDDGKNSDNETVCNPTIGYGLQTLHYANGTTRDFFQIGLSANKQGISIYLIGLKDKKYLIQTFAHRIGKASITGYCIKFKSLQDIHLEVLEEIIQYGFNNATQ